MQSWETRSDSQDNYRERAFARGRKTTHDMNLGGWGFVLWPGAALKARQREPPKLLRDCMEGGLGEGQRSRPKGARLFPLSLRSLFCNPFLFLLNGNWGFPSWVSYRILGFVECESLESVLSALIRQCYQCLWILKLESHAFFSAGQTSSKEEGTLSSSSEQLLHHALPAPLKDS